MQNNLTNDMFGCYSFTAITVEKSRGQSDKRHVWTLLTYKSETKLRIIIRQHNAETDTGHVCVPLAPIIVRFIDAFCVVIAIFTVCQFSLPVFHSISQCECRG